MLTRRAPMRRTQLRRRREEPRRSSFFLVPDYVDHLRALGCSTCRYFGLACIEPIVIHHMREGGGASLRRPDTWAMPVGNACHMRRHAHAREFDIGRAAVNHIERVICGGLQSSWFGRALVDADDITVRAAVEAGAPTRGLYAAAHPLTAGVAGIEAM